MTALDSVAKVEGRLAALGLQLPESPPRPAGSYRATVVSNGLLFISGQLPSFGGKVQFTGRVGAELSEAQGIEAARLAALNVLAQIKVALGGFDSLETLLRVEGHVSSAVGWFDQPKVLDGASDLFNTVLAEKAGHARSAFAHAQLPLNAAVLLVVTASIRPTPQDSRQKSPLAL
jgi:enamine deaminase RidA (YjgF/YER057c/UK114 family)